MADTEIFTYEISMDNQYWIISSVISTPQTITIPTTHTGEVGGTTLTLPVKEIKANVFNQKSNIRYVFMGNTIETIGDNAFANCSGLLEITLSSNLNSLGNSCFYQCNNLTTVNYNGTLTSWCGITFNSDSNPIKNVNKFYLESNNEDTKYELTGAIEIPNNIQTIKDYAFDGFKNITRLTFQNNSQLETIGARAFQFCINLEQVIMPDSLENLGAYAFSGCSSLSEVVLPSNNSSFGNIGIASFLNCISLKTIYIPKILTRVGMNAFYGCSNLLNVLYDSNDPADWNAIVIGNNNTPLNDAIKYYYRATPPIDTSDNLNYWGKDANNNFVTYNLVGEQIAHLEDNNSVKDGYKVMIVPIKINTDYTIYIDSSVPIEIYACYYDGVNLLNTYMIDSSKVYVKNTNCSFSQPFVYRVNQDSIKEDNGNKIKTDIKVLENQLVMLLQIPEINTSTVVVLEGNYTNVNLLPNGELSTEEYFGKSFNQLPIEVQNSYFKTLSSLLNIADGQNYAFNDRLLEYLLLNVIDSEDEISQNIKRVQDYITSSKFYNTFNTKYKNNYIKGVWDVGMRKYIYDLVTQKTKNNLIYDVNGFVDKDTESILIKGKEDDLKAKMGVR